MPSSSHTEKNLDKTTNIVGDHYKVGKKIGEGSFGIIYEGKHAIESALNQLEHTIILGKNVLNDQQVAIKFESRKSETPQLSDEYKTYKIMAGTSKTNSNK